MRVRHLGIIFAGYVLVAPRKCAVAVFAHDFMAIEIGGGFNIGLVFGLLQFVTTFLITWLYIQFANKQIEPQAAAIREEMEG